MNWPQVRIRDVAVTFDGPHATPKSSKTATSGPVFLGISSLDAGRLDLSRSAFLSEDDFTAWTRRVTPQPDDVVFSYETRLGQAAIIPPGFRGSLGRRLALMRPDRSKVEPTFLLYYYLGPEFQEVIRRNTVQGSTVDRIMLRDFPEFPISLPPLPEQRFIGETLAAIDGKIDSNLRAVGLIRELIAAEFAWVTTSTQSRREALIELATITKGVSYKSADLQPSRTSLVTLKSFDRNGGYKADGLKPYTGPYKDAQVIEPGDIVVAQTDLTQGAEVVGRAVRVPAAGSADRLVASLDLVVVRPRTSIMHEYLLGVLTSDGFRQHCRSRTSGTTVLHLSSDAIPSYDAPVVDRDTQQRFAERVRPALAHMDQLGFESAKLQSLRDALLPELLSGRLRSNDALESIA